MKKQNFRPVDILLLTFVLVLAFTFRLYKIDSPLADLHSWRQADTAAVARNFVRNGIDFLHPRYDDLSSIETGIENPQGYRMVEFPIYNAIVASAYKVLPFLSLETVGRLTTVFFSLIIIGILYFLLFKEVGRLAAFGGSIVYAVFPFFVFFSRVILPETAALAFTFISVLLLYLYSHKQTSRYIEIPLLFFSALFFAGALLIKPTVIFYGLTLLYLFVKKFRLNIVKKFDVYIFFAVAVIPFVLWRLYIRSFPEGIPASDWLFTSVNTYQGLKTVFLRPAFFRWIFFERINEMMFGGYLSLLFVMGVLRKNTKFFLQSLLISALLYLFVFEGGNVQHEYYQTVIFPPFAMFVGIGVEFLWSIRKFTFSTAATILIISILYMTSFLFAYYKVKDFYNVPSDLTAIARVIKSISDPEDKIVTDRSGDTTLLYLADRKGWPAYSGNLDDLKSKGYKYFITAHSDLVLQLKTGTKYKVVFANDQFTVFKL